MSTRSNIGIINRDGSVEMIYCHWDGYPSNNGKLLLNHWASEARVRELLALGDLSSLGEEIGEKHNFDFQMKLNPEDAGYQRSEKMCNCYLRDRGEKGKDLKARKYKTVNEVENAFDDDWADYLYLWDCKTNTWLYKGGSGNLRILTKRACKE